MPKIRVKDTKSFHFSAGHIPPHVRAAADGGDAGEDHDQGLPDRKLSCAAIYERDYESTSCDHPDNMYFANTVVHLYLCQDRATYLLTLRKR